MIPSCAPSGARAAPPSPRSPATGSTRPRPSAACAISSASRRLTASRLLARRNGGGGERAPLHRAHPVRSAPGPAAAAARSVGEVLAIDAATRANLELTRTLSGERAGSLLAAIDRTVCPSGARLLAERLGGPLTDVGTILRRQEAVAFLIEETELRERLRKLLRTVPDIARALSRLSSRAAARADLACLRDGLDAACGIELLAGAEELPAELAEATRARSALSLFGDRRSARRGACGRAVAQSARRQLRADGARPALDEARELQQDRAASSRRCSPATRPRPAAGRCASSTTTCSATTSRCRRRWARSSCAARGRKPSSTVRPWRTPCASRPWSSARSRPASPRRRTGRSRSSSASSIGCAGSSSMRGARSPRPPRRSPSSTSRPRSRSWRRRRAGAARRSTGASPSAWSASATPWSRRRSSATARRSSRTTATSRATPARMPAASP